ncbi:hypothetical protein IWX50DRAFT_621032 [Phyllosticta citricarpa]|uniref:Uncharacterized protein n=1 Tax=Phyllosticta citricarpa TaxID=55181 RepID=A0ABR1LH96_9PEZI
MLVPLGHQRLFDPGVLHCYQYGHLYPNNGSKILVRSTTGDRMTQSAEYFLVGFFGLGWTQNATLELIIEEDGYNNSLVGYDNCPNSNLEFLCTDGRTDAPCLRSDDFRYLPGIGAPFLPYM